MKIYEIASSWKDEHFQYVKASTKAAYALILKNHIFPNFGNEENIKEEMVQKFVNDKLEEGVSIHTITDIIIVIKMILKFGAKHHWCDAPIDWKIRYPTRTVDSKRLPCWNASHQKKDDRLLERALRVQRFGSIDFDGDWYENWRGVRPSLE